MPNIKSNRVRLQGRQDRRDNRLSGPGRRFTARLEAEENTRLKKLERRRG